MAKKITITLSQKSIQEAINQIKAYKNDLTYKCQLLAEKLAEKGVEIARLQLADLDAIFTTELISSVHVEYKGSVKKFPMIRVSGYSVELVGISEKTYEQLSGKQVHLKNKEIVYIQNEYKTYNGKKVTMGAMDYGRKGYTWLMPGSFDKEKDEYVSPESNHPIASKDWDHLYRMKRIEAGNWF